MLYNLDAAIHGRSKEPLKKGVPPQGGQDSSPVDTRPSSRVFAFGGCGPQSGLASCRVRVNSRQDRQATGPYICGFRSTPADLEVGWLTASSENLRYVQRGF
jgi:hypothetical protein